MVQDTLTKQPVIQMLPTAGLVVPDWNPRKIKEAAALDELVAFLEKGGQVPRILVWGGDGKSVIAGQRRLEAFIRLGKSQIEAEILDITLEEAQDLARSTNEGKPLHWLDRYESWEPYLTPDPRPSSRGASLGSAGSRDEVYGVPNGTRPPDRGLTEDEVAAKLGVDSRWIRRAKPLLGVLSPASRRLIREKLAKTPSDEDTKNKGNNEIPESFRNDTETLKKPTLEKPKKWMLNEDTAFRLTQLWDKRSQGDAQALVEKALPVILSREMNAPQVDGLVKWVAQGNEPKDFNATVKGGNGERSKSKSQERTAPDSTNPPAV